MASHVRYQGGFRWRGVAVHPYKPEGSCFRDVTRQVLFAGDGGGRSELRYFEVGAGGHTTLERHQHVHQVVIVRGRGRALVDGSVVEVAPFDLVAVPPRSWHQFRAADDEALGFLCLVDAERDRPERPGEADLAELRRDPRTAEFLRL